ncbi:MAG: transposase [Magnetococcus sp. THC-1_WYH]
MMPKNFPPWVWEAALDKMNRVSRRKKKRSADPCYGIVDAKSVKTQFACDEIGYDGGKKVKRHKRHIAVDILGDLLHILVHVANLNDTKKAYDVLEGTYDKYTKIRHFSEDWGYRRIAVKFVEKRLDITLHILMRIKDGFAVLPKRWIVKRTFA